jgi:hypothetical protein
MSTTCSKETSMTCGCQNKTDDFCPDASEAPDAVAEVTTRQPLHRRTFIKATAIGGAVAAIAGRTNLSPFSASAASPCTAGDIEVSNGVISNEPCVCNGTFQAVAAFQVRNDNNATRKCVTIILGAGGTFGGQSFLLTVNPDGTGGSSIAGLHTTQTMYARLGNLSCNFSQECYADSVIAFQTAQNNSDTACSGPLTRFPGGQCRRQTICVTGYGVSLACATANCATTGSANCAVGCGGTLYLSAAAVGHSQGATATYTYTLYRDGIQVGGPQSSGCFTVANPIAGSYTVVVADSLGCTRTSNAVAVTVSQLAAPVVSTSGPDCSGNVTYTITNCDNTLKYTYKEVNCTTNAVVSTIDSGVGLCSKTVQWPQDDADHCVVVTVSKADDSCPVDSAKALNHVGTAATFHLGPVNAGCDGTGHVTAVAQGGTAPYTFTFLVNGVEVQSGSSDRYDFEAQLDGTCRTITVAVVDSAECGAVLEVGEGKTASRSISQCVTTTEC